MCTNEFYTGIRTQDAVTVLDQCMGSICPCLRKGSSQRQTPYDAHETFDTDYNVGSVPTTSADQFHALSEEPHLSANAIHKTPKNESRLMENVGSKASSDPNSGINNREIDEEEGERHKGSAKSLIRQRLNQQMRESSSDQSLSNLQGATKIISTIYNQKREVRISSCLKSKILVFDTSQQVSISNCTDCLIFVAPCAGSIHVVDCKELKLISISRQLKITNCKECDISLFCATSPVLISSNEICFSNFLRIGYFEMYQQFYNSGLDVWNNRFQDVDDEDKHPEEEHYSMKKLHSFDLEWDRVIEQERIEPGDPIIPLFWVDIARNKRQMYVINEPMREIELKVLKHIVSKNICLYRAHKGVLPLAAFERMKNLFGHHEENKYLCLIMGNELESSGFEAYFDKIRGSEVQEMERLIFRSLNEEQ